MLQRMNRQHHKTGVVSAKFAGLGIVSDTGNQWIRIGTVQPAGSSDSLIVVDVSDGGASYKLPEMVRFEGDLIHLRLRKSGEMFSFDYSEDGARWTSLKENLAMALPRPHAYLTVFAWGDSPATAVFSGVRRIRHD